jgi:hypothetical protein
MLTFVQAEWDKYFPLEQNTGDLNVADFDMGAFTGGYGGPRFDPLSVAAAVTTTPNAFGSMNPSAQDMSDISFTPTYYPNMGPSKDTLRDY